MESLIIIPARSGSTRVPNKNLAEINGKPLIYYSIKASLKTDASQVIVSTDSDEIADISKSFGAEVPFLRPRSISHSTSSSISVIIHTLLKLIENKNQIPEVIIFKPPTNPFLSGNSIQEMLNFKLSNRNIDSLMSIHIPKISALSFLSFSNESKKIKTQIYDINGVRLYDIERSQDRPISYASSPACKITETRYFLEKYIDKKIALEKCSGPTFNYENSSGYLVDSLEAHDIDNIADFELAKLIIENGKKLINDSKFSHLH